jgi:hypothetical protein
VPATGIDVTIRSKVSFQQASGMFRYDYELVNLPTSRQAIDNFEVVTAAPARDEDFTAPQGWGGLPETNQAGPFPALYSWTPLLGEPIAPGRSLAGFGFKTAGPPAIIESLTRGEKPLLDVTQAMAPGPSGLDDAVKRPIVGPVPPAPTFNLQAEFDRVLALKHEACRLSWITNQGVCNSLNVKLDNARAKAITGQAKAAHNQLRAFLHELEAQRGKHVSEDAYQLLAPNVEFLQSRL